MLQKHYVKCATTFKYKIYFELLSLLDFLVKFLQNLFFSVSFLFWVVVVETHWLKIEYRRQNGSLQRQYKPSTRQRRRRQITTAVSKNTKKQGQLFFSKKRQKKIGKK